MTVLVSNGQVRDGGDVSVRAYQASSYVSGASGTGFAEEYKKKYKSFTTKDTK